MSITTIASHFSVDAAPSNETIRLSGGSNPKRLVLDILALAGGSTPTIQVILTELVESTKDIQVLSSDANAIDSFTPGRTFRGSQSGKYAVVAGQRAVSGTHYLAYVSGGPSQFFDGDNLTEVGLTRPNVAALAVVDSLASQSFIQGAQIADTTAVRVDTAVDIAPGTKDRPAPHRPRLARLSYVFSGGPSNVSFLVRVSG